MIKKSRIFWFLRKMWHYPHMYSECVKPATFWSYNEYGDKLGKKGETWFRDWHILDYRCIFYSPHKWKRFKSLFLYHLKGMFYRLKYAPLYYIGLRCNGNSGGWRTTFCEWLENKARECEEIENNFFR